MIKKIEEKLYKMWKFREEAKGTMIYDLRDARLNGAVAMLDAMGYLVFFNPLAENKNPFKVKEK
jgi:hypothetical protein